MKLLDLIPESELKEVVLSEYEKRFVLYKLTDERFKKKYSMSFAEFEAKNVVKKKILPGKLKRMLWNGNMQLKA